MPGSAARIWKTIAKRSHRKFLSRLKTAKPISVTSRSTPLPGIGHRFWQTAQAHLYAMEFAPYMHESCHVVEMHEVAMSSAAVMDYLKHCWDLENKSLYHMRWNEAQCYKQSEFIFIDIPVSFKHPDRYQDGQPIIKDKCMKLFHGTRETNVRNILHQGLQSSHLAHKVIGTWVNSCFAEAINWNYSILDLLPGVALTVKCNKQELRQNADIMSYFQVWPLPSNATSRN